MLGDPGTAKSQLLKFVEKCSPIGVGGVARLVSSSCSLCTTKDQAMIADGRYLPVHPQLDGLAEA